MKPKSLSIGVRERLKRAGCIFQPNANDVPIKKYLSGYANTEAI
ncbi:hypothetical protein [Williamwhitmania taraxaci]|nr:hypothetical protein [Williamwhitmania taraxaci]